MQFRSCFGYVPGMTPLPQKRSAGRRSEPPNVLGTGPRHLKSIVAYFAVQGTAFPCDGESDEDSCVFFFGGARVLIGVTVRP